MGVETPDLGDIEYEGVLADARSTVAARVGAWSDLNPSDPGVTITELLAWQTATRAYQIDRHATAHRRKHLQLLGVDPRPPAPATATVSLSPTEAAAGRRLDVGTRLRAEGVAFETERPVSLTVATVDRIYVTAGECRNRPPTSLTDADRVEPTVRPFGTDPGADDALLLGFRRDPFGDTPVLSLRISLDFTGCPSPAPGPSALVPSVDCRWEGWTGETWAPLAVLDDGTDDLYRSGVVRLGRPDGWDSRDGQTWLRCRLSNGGYEIPPRIETLATNGLSVSQRRTAGTVTLDRPENGVALGGQTYAFPDAPVQSATVTVDGTAWTAVDDFDASGPGDRHYVLDRAAGTVRFGGGWRGVAPSPGATVQARAVVYGGGTDGNVAAPEWTVPGVDGVTVTGNDPTGGSDAESIDAAVRRVRDRVDSPTRAVTTGDYARLATETPGTRIARATAHVDPDSPTVTVVVVPYTPPDCGRPVPSQGLLDAVEQYLERRRLLTDRVEAEPPRYVPLEVTVAARCRQTYVEGADRAVETAVASYLDPLRGAGGDGWPVGEELSLSSLRAEIEATDAVETVTDLGVTPYGSAAVTDGCVSIGGRSLFALAAVETDLVTERGTRL